MDDSIDKISEVSKLIYETTRDAKIATAANIHNAITLLADTASYDLAIIDLYLPLRANEEPLKDGGKLLLNEIYRKKNLNIPKYIIGCTQMEVESDFSNIWRVIDFSYSSSEWKMSLKSYINHIKGTITSKTTESESIPTIFVEGLTDKYYIEAAINIFFSDYQHSIKVVSQKNAGANWVATQIPIWGMALAKDENGNYIKAVGLLDSDEAGNIARQKVDNRNLSDSEKQCCGLYQLKPYHNPEILNFYRNKSQIEIEIESLFSLEILKHAESEGWLEYRSKTFVEIPNDWRQHEENVLEYFNRKNIEAETTLYIKKVKMEYKQQFCMYVKGLEQKESFKNFETLVEELLIKIGIIKTN